jgi:two-component system sensor histidine kinase UhpB
MQAAVGTTAPRRRPVFDLKWSLLWQVVAVALLCCLGGVAVVLYEVDEEAWQANRSLGDAIARYLELPLHLWGADRDVQFSRFRFLGRFREADAVFTNVMDPGQCVAYINGDGLTEASSCLGFSNRKWRQNGSRRSTSAHLAIG